MGEGQRDTGDRRRHARYHQISDLRNRAQSTRANDGPPEQKGAADEGDQRRLLERRVIRAAVHHRGEL